MSELERKVRALIRRCELATEMTLGCDINGNKFEARASLSDLRALLAPVPGDSGEVAGLSERLPIPWDDPSRHQVTQTILASSALNDVGIYGNCVQAAVASLLGRPLEAVPHFGAFSAWKDALRLWCEGEDLTFEVMDYPDVIPADEEPCLYLGRSPRGFLHVVVGLGGETIWDPHPSRDGIDAIDGVLRIYRAAATPPTEPAAVEHVNDYLDGDGFTYCQECSDSGNGYILTADCSRRSGSECPEPAAPERTVMCPGCMAGPGDPHLPDCPTLPLPHEEPAAPEAETARPHDVDCHSIGTTRACTCVPPEAPAPHGEIKPGPHDTYICADCGQNINKVGCSAKTPTNDGTWTGILNDPTQQLDRHGVVLAAATEFDGSECPGFGAPPDEAPTCPTCGGDLFSHGIVGRCVPPEAPAVEAATKPSHLDHTWPCPGFYIGNYDQYRIGTWTCTCSPADSKGAEDGEALALTDPRVEELAWVIARAPTEPGLERGETIRVDPLSLSRALLTSDWLASLVAAREAEVLREAAAAIAATCKSCGGLSVEDSGCYISDAMHVLRDRAAAIARGDRKAGE